MSEWFLHGLALKYVLSCATPSHVIKANTHDIIELELGLSFARSFLSLEKKIVVVVVMKNIKQINSILQYIVIFLIQAQFYDNCIASPLLLHHQSTQSKSPVIVTSMWFSFICTFRGECSDLSRSSLISYPDLSRFGDVEM